MTGTPLIIIALLLILGITIYSYFKNGSEKIMVKKELEDRLIPITIRRTLPNGDYQNIAITDFK